VTGKSAMDDSELLWEEQPPRDIWEIVWVIIIEIDWLQVRMSHLQTLERDLVKISIPKDEIDCRLLKA